MTALVLFLALAYRPQESDVQVIGPVQMASVNGKYAELQAIIPCPRGWGAGLLSDYGWWDGGSWSGRHDWPKGYYVRVGADWFIWRVRVRD